MGRVGAFMHVSTLVARSVSVPLAIVVFYGAGECNLAGAARSLSAGF